MSVTSQGSGDAGSHRRRRPSLAATVATSYEISDIPKDPPSKSSEMDFNMDSLTIDSRMPSDPVEIDPADAPRPVATGPRGSSPVAGPSRPGGSLSEMPMTSTDDEPPIHVELRQCGQCPHLPTFLPECLKICTYLKAMGATVKVTNYMLNFTGLYPRVKFQSGIIYENTDLLMDCLTEELTKGKRRHLDHKLTPDEQIQAYALAALTEDYLAGEHREWYRAHHGELLKAYGIELTKNWKKWPALRGRMLEKAFKASSSKEKSKSEQPVRTTNSETIVKKLAEKLGTKRFFFGDDIVTTLDVVVFAVLTPIMLMSLNVTYPLRDHIREHYPKLEELTLRVRKRYYRDEDWTYLCAGDSADASSHAAVFLQDDSEKSSSAKPVVC